MDLPIGLSQNFVNKQNVRSFGNIVNPKLLKNLDEESFLKHLLGDISLVSKISTDFRQNLSTLKTNLHNKSKEDFKNCFATINKERSTLCSVNKEDIFGCCWTALNEIVPKSFLGSNHNTKIFRKLVFTVIYSMNRQHIFLTNCLEKWDFSSTIWKFLSENESKKILINILIWMIRHILSAMICLNFYVTTCKLDADDNKLHFFWKSQWQSFYDKKISNMIFCKFLRRFEPYCLGKKTKRKYTIYIGDRLKLKSLKKDIPKLHLILKPNNDCRPIVHYKNDQHNSKEKYKMKDRLNLLKTLTGKTKLKLESQFNSIYHKWLNLNKPKLYFIKTDLSNAFGLINKEKLMKILCERHINFQKTETSLYLKKKVAQHYKEMVTELRKPLLVRAGHTVYEWMEGLVQGYKYSPALSELYYNYLDEKNFSDHLKEPESQIRFFVRVVDDYLYITDSLLDAHLFLNALSNYRNVNSEKTVVNFEHESIKFSEEITFLGYSYNTNTLQVSRASNVCTGQMCYKIAFSGALANLAKFLENRIGQSGIQINGHIFNLYHNSEEIIWQHVFTTFCLSANKFCTILAITCHEKDMKKYLLLYKKRVTVKLGNAIIETLMRNKPVEFLFMYCINHFRYLSFKALFLCAKQTSRCSGLVSLINEEMAKSNCIYGKWKEHACRIETNGEIRRLAIREICRRADLRLIMKKFNTLPSGFQCYDHRKLN